MGRKRISIRGLGVQSFECNQRGIQCGVSPSKHSVRCLPLGLSLALALLLAEPSAVGDGVLSFPAINADGSRIALRYDRPTQTSEEMPWAIQVHETTHGKLAARGVVVDDADHLGLNRNDKDVEREVAAREQRFMRQLRRAGFRTMKGSGWVDVWVDVQHADRTLPLMLREKPKARPRALRSWRIQLPPRYDVRVPGHTYKCAARGIGAAGAIWDARTGWAVIVVRFENSGGHPCAYASRQLLARIPQLRRPTEELE